MIEVHRVLGREFTESSYLARQLLVFDDRQHVTGLSETIISGFGVNVKTTICTGSGRL